jgi:hypothetical protein
MSRLSFFCREPAIHKLSMLSSSCVFVPGAWHSADGFDIVVELLAAKGLTSWKVGLPSVGRSPPVPSLGPDVEAVYNAVLAEMQ